jgi:tRNA(Ile)-lysidine synthase
VPLIRQRSDNALYGENAARNARYEFLANASRQMQATKIATAHHADDQIETVLFRMLRGTGIRGLAGIPVRRGKVIRPFLRFYKRELDQYAMEHGIRFREDETNSTNAYARNRIRRAVIPALQTVTPNAHEGVLSLARRAARAERAWLALMKDARRSVVIQRNHDFVELARAKLLGYDPEVRARLLRTAVRSLGVMPDRRTTNGLLRFVNRGASGRAIMVSGGLRCERAYDVIRLAHPGPATRDETVTIADCADGTGVAVLAGKQWRIEWTTSQNGSGRGAMFNCAELAFPLQIRAWLPGDRARFVYGAKKLKKVFAEARVPAHARGSVPVLADAAGRILWVADIARSTDAVPLPNTPALTVTIDDAEIS